MCLKRILVILIACLTFLFPYTNQNVFAEEVPPLEATTPKEDLPSGETRMDIVTYWGLDFAIIAATGVTWLALELSKSGLGPKTCVWCKSNPMDDAITEALSWSHPEYAAKTADYVDFIGIPLVTLGAMALSSGLEGRIEAFPSDVILTLEVFILSSFINQVVKYSVGRERPYVSRGNSGLYNKPADDNLSFYSGHTNMAFAFVTAAGTIAHIRGYEAEPYIWGFGMPIAAFVAYARVAGQKHYFSDVLVGALMGGLVGFLVPFLHRKEVRSDDSLLPRRNFELGMSPGGISVSGVF